MLLQNDKSTVVLDRERASRILYGDAEPMVATSFPAPETTQMFNNNHDLVEYDKLVQNEYQNKVAEQPTHQNFNFEKYYNDANPVPETMHQSYRAKVLTDFPDFKVETEKTFNPTNEALMEKVAETEIIENTLAVNSSVESESYLRLNARGLIACVAFVAITALIIALVVINSISIGKNNIAVNNLKAENMEIVNEYNQAMADRQDAFNTGVGNANGSGGGPPEIIDLPPIGDYNLAPESSDYSSNLFDQICKFLSSIFS